MRTEFIFERAPFAQCHASTIAETPSGLVAAWFGGTREKHPDVGIWLSRHDGAAWSDPIEVANGVTTEKAVGGQPAQTRYPCWNPVLYQAPEGPLLLFYKVGPSPSEWWGMLRTSGDGGLSWSAARRLPPGILGPVKNKPIPLNDGSLLCPSSGEVTGWAAHFERTPDLGETWERIGPVNPQSPFQVIQPTLLRHGSHRLQALFRSKQGVIVEAWSVDEGRTWGDLQPTALPNPNSGIDAVTLADGRHVLAYNHVGMEPGRWGGPRTPLNLAVSHDGADWRMVLVLEDQPGEYSYPAVIQGADGLVHVTYTYRRRTIKHVTLSPDELA